MSLGNTFPLRNVVMLMNKPKTRNPIRPSKQKVSLKSANVTYQYALSRNALNSTNQSQ